MTLCIVSSWGLTGSPRWCTGTGCGTTLALTLQCARAMLESTPVTPTTYPAVAREQEQKENHHQQTAVTWTPPLICSQEGTVARGASPSSMAQMFSAFGESVD